MLVVFLRLHCSDNRVLLNDILREEWGFKGMVVTDWGALCNRVKAMHAGCDLSMPGGSSYMEDHVAEAVRSGKIPESDVDACAARVIALALKSQTLNKGNPFDIDAHHDLARRIAESGAVLMKNEDGILPVDTSDCVLIGAMAKNMRYQGSGSSHINPTKLTSLCEALPEVPHVMGCDDMGGVTEESIAEAVTAAKKAKTAIVCAGLLDIYESEGFDRETIMMPEGHLRMIHAVASANPNTVVVLFCGSVVEMPWFDEVKGILYMGLPGQAGGLAAADLLRGTVSPSGKLTESWPLSLDDVPSEKTFGKKYTPYTEGIYVGYRYYDKAGVKVRLPFGYGLSYTEFAWTDLKINGMSVSAVITNTGKTAGAEVVQLYVAAPKAGIHRPVKELKGFEKVFLQPGESREVSFSLDDRCFAVWNSGWKTQKGTYTIELGSSSADIRLKDIIEVEGEDIPVPEWQSGSWYETLQGKPVDNDFEAAYGGTIMKEPEIRKGQLTMKMSIMEMKDHSAVMNRMFKETVKTIAKGFGGKVDYDNPTFKMMVMSGADAPLRAAVLSSSGAFPTNVAEGMLELANGHPLKGIKKLSGK